MTEAPKEIELVNWDMIVDRIVENADALRSMKTVPSGIVFHIPEESVIVTISARKIVASQGGDDLHETEL